jgi:excisionase family DNA binding protein
MTMDDFLFTAEVARLLGKSAETVRLYERRGKLPAQRTSRGIRLFRRADVLKLLEAMTSNAPQET